MGCFIFWLLPNLIHRRCHCGFLDQPVSAHRANEHIISACSH